MPKIAICGGPRTGKTTLGKRLAEHHGVQLLSTDDFMGANWDLIPDLVIAELKGKDAWILEGVQTGRVLRRWLQADAPQMDGVYWLETPLVELTDRQASFAKGCASVFRDVRPLLNKRAIPIFPGLPNFRPIATPAGQ